MAGTSPKAEEGKKKARIEIIPLIDVIFFLLATFVLFTLSLDKIESITLQLPVASATSASKPDEDMVTIQVSDADTYYWNHEPIQAADLKPKLQEYARTNQNPRVFLTCDNRAKFKTAIFAIDQIRLAKITQFSVDTRGVRATGS